MALLRIAKGIIAAAGILVTALGCVSVYGQEGASEKGRLILHQAKQYKKAQVGVEAHLKGDILEVMVATKVYADRPKIDNVIVVGPRLGRLAPKAKETLYAGERETAPFEATESRGLFGFGSRSKAREIKGALIRELFKFKIPPGRLIKGRRYELRVRIDSQKIPGKFLKFEFELKDLARLMLEENN